MYCRLVRLCATTRVGSGPYNVISEEEADQMCSRQIKIEERSDDRGNQPYRHDDATAVLESRCAVSARYDEGCREGTLRNAESSGL